MKRTLFIEILLVLIFSLLIALNIYLWRDATTFKKVLDTFSDPEPYIKSCNIRFTYSVLALIANFSTFLAMILVAIKDLPVFQPLRDKFAMRKSARLQAKAEKSKAEKQARIEQLQAELEELKRD